MLMTKFTNYTPCIVDYEAAMLSALSYCRRNLGRYKMANGDDPMALIAGEIDALLARHNALVEAVHGLLGALANGEFKPTVATDGHVARIAAQRVYEINRAEVDRLIANESADDCEGEG